MPILNYTTTIDSRRTAGQVQQLLAETGASTISTDYSDGQPVAVTFVMRMDRQYLNFRVTADVDGVLEALKASEIPKRYKTRDHAQNVAWRIVKDWIEAQLAFIEARNASVVQVFLPFVVREDGATVYDALRAGSIKGLLGERING